MPAGWAAGIGAVAGAAEDISNNKAAESASKANAGSVNQLQGAQGAMLTQAQQVAQQPFQAYTGTLTAPMSGNQQQAYGIASQEANAGVAQGDNTAATGLIGQVAGNGWNANTAQTYMNPYISQVNNAADANLNHTYLQSLAQAQTGAAGAGAFGNSREAIQEGELAGQNQLNQATVNSQNLSNAYNTAVNTWQSDNQMKLNAANAYEQAGQDVTQMDNAQISNLLQTGNVAQVIAQTDLNNQYGQFTRQQGWSANQLNSLINAVGTAKGSTTQQPQVQSNTANQLLGLGSTIAGLWGGSSPSGTPTVGNSLGNAPDIVNNMGLTSSLPTGH